MSRRSLLLPGLLALFAVAAIAVILVMGVGHDERVPGSALERPSAGGATEGVLDTDRTDGAPSGDGIASAGPTGGGTGPKASEVHGEVLDEADRPIAGADVSLVILPLAARRGVPVAASPMFSRASTDGRGEFTLAGPPEGSMRVTASAPGRGTVGTLVGARGAHVVLRLPAAGSLRVTVLDDAGVPLPGASVEVAAASAVIEQTTGTEGTASFTALAPGPAVARARAEGYAEATAGSVLVAPGEVRECLLMLEKSVALGGRVVDERTGVPIAGADVYVARPGRAVRAGPTGADGAFAPVPAGAPGEEVLVGVTARGYAPALLPFVLSAPEGASATALVRLRAAEAWTGRVVDASGRAVPGARVAYTEDGIAGKAPDETLTDAEGRFELPPPPPPAPGRRVVLVAEGAAGRGALALRPDMPRPDDLVLTLLAGVAVTGRIARSDGSPLAGVEVGLDVAWDLIDGRSAPDAPTSRLHALNAEGFEGLTTATDASGRFALAAVPAGTFRVRSGLAGSVRWIAEPVVLGVAPLDLGTLTVGAGRSLEGRVRDAAGGAAAGATVRATLPQAGARGVGTQTDGAGNFSLQDLAVGTWMVQATLPGFMPAVIKVEVPSAGSVEFVLDPGAVIEGVVTENGEPRRGVFIVRLDAADAEYYGAGSSLRRRTFRGADGRFVFDGLYGGSWFVRAEAPGGLVAMAPQPIEVGPGLRPVVSLALRPTGGLVGRVLDSKRRSVAGARLLLRPDGPGSPERATADADGRYAFAGLLPGTYALDASGRGGVPATERVEVGAGERRTFDVVLAEGGSLKLVVKDASGRAREGAMVTFRSADGKGLRGEEPTRTGRDGIALREDLPEGRITVRARTTEGETGTVAADVARGAVREVTVVVSRP